MRRIVFPIALLALAACGGKHVSFTGDLRYGKTAEEDYQSGIDEMKAESWPEAVKFFEHVKTKYPFSQYAALSDLRIADTKFKQERYLEAADAYDGFSKLHPTHDEVDYAEYRAGVARFKDAPGDWLLFPPSFEKDQRQLVKAVESLKTFVQKRPQSKYAPDAQKLLGEAEARLAAHEWYVADFYYKRKRWAGAAGRLQGLVDKYPDSKHDVQALFRLAEAYQKMDERTRAQRALQQLIARHPQDPRRPEAEQLLAKLR
ncbi:MAG TPA: outer membrane protein assembly factor BamD [Anaeromyxobacteraceae bacterium]|nr:outer membrane protein assembly factor BamD [Anaeromyxobacteraceae bacterium]